MHTIESSEEHRVSAGTSAVTLSRLVTSVLTSPAKRGHQLLLSAVAPGAVNQAVKACAIAHKHLQARGWELSMHPRIEDGVGRDPDSVISRIVFVVTAEEVAA